MFKKIIPAEYKKLYALFNRKDRMKILIIFLMMIMASLLEVAGIGMIPLFISIVSDPDRLFAIEPLGAFLNNIGIVTSSDLLTAGAVVLIGIFVLKGTYLLFFHYIKTKFIHNRLYLFGSRLMTSYMRAPYTFHLGRNSSELLRNITSEVSIFLNQVLNPILDLTKAAVLIISVMVFLLVLEPLITISVFVFLGSSMGVFLMFTRKRVEVYGEKLQEYRAKMLQAVEEGLGGLKEARVLNREDEFIRAFREMAFLSARYQATVLFIKHIPRPVIEAVAVGGMMFIALIMIWQGRPLVDIIPVLTLFGVATIRLMPAIQTLSSTLTTLSSNMVSVNPIHDDLKMLEDEDKAFVADRKNPGKLTFDTGIEIRSVGYRYPGSNEQAVDGISLTIPKGKAVAFVGSSGAGKTTIVDLLLGLLKPERGEILVDGMDIFERKSAWQRNIGYIPQFIYLSDDTLRRNIAFGIPEQEIDDIRIRKAITLAQLDELVGRLPEGLGTMIGQDGTRLSGGQRQRVGIARALYHEPEVLVMDEATSALDNITEKEITKAIDRLKGERTIIMIAHRLTTVQNCDVLYLMKEGRITDSGNYEGLLKDNRDFRKMALVD